MIRWVGPKIKYVYDQSYSQECKNASIHRPPCLQARFRKGDDLNTIVYNHYDTRVDPTQYIGVNYVSNDGLLAKK